MDEQQDHYFSAHPASPAELRRVSVRLAGRDVEVVTAGGIFSPDGIDKGTRILLEEVPPPPSHGTFLDLGCGWGPLALTLALESPDATVHAVDVNERALDLAARNAAALGCDGVLVSTPDAVDPATRLDLLWSNPPIRVGKAVLHEMLTTWLPRLAEPGGEGVGHPERGVTFVVRTTDVSPRPAADGTPVTPALREEAGGTAYLVVQKNLGADSLQSWLRAHLPALMGPVAVDRVATSKGFRVLRVTRS